MSSAAPAYVLTLRSGARYTLADDGRVLHRSDVDPAGQGPYQDWHVLGFLTRFHSRERVSLADAANGAWIGQGWVMVRDHGTLRTWAHPSNRRCASIVRTAQP